MTTNRAVRSVCAVRFTTWLLMLLIAVTSAGCAQFVSIPKVANENVPERYVVAVRGEMLKPDGEGPFPAVILMHGCQGLAPAPLASLRWHAGFLKKHGYVSLIVDSLGPRGKNGDRVCSSHHELGEARTYRVADAVAARAYLVSQSFVDASNIFLIGQSNGGSVAIIMSRRDVRHGFTTGVDAFRGVVAYYPWCGVGFGEMVSPLLILAGERDNWTSASECRYMRVSHRDKPIELIVYEGAHHSFDLSIPIQKYSGHTVGYNAKAARQSQEAYLSFFERLREAN